MSVKLGGTIGLSGAVSHSECAIVPAIGQLSTISAQQVIALAIVVQ